MTMFFFKEGDKTQREGDVMVGTKMEGCLYKPRDTEGCQQPPEARREMGKGSPSKTPLMLQWLGIPLPVQGTWVDSWSKKIPHANKQLSLCAINTEAMNWNYWSLHALNLCSAIREATAMRSLHIATRVAPACHAATGESLRTAVTTQSAQK